MSEETPVPDESLDPGVAADAESQQDLFEDQLETVPELADPEDPELNQAHLLPFLIVGIGASAGGLEAFIGLFSSLPRDTGMAFVVVTHLAADKKSHMAEILAQHTAMRVSELEELTVPEPNHVYVLPANSFVTMSRGVLLLGPRPVGTHIQKPIDHFFLSLAADQKTRVIGVVLSGMDSDGAIGLKTIKNEGGISIVQEPASATFPSMPRSSIAADHVDLIVPPAQIGIELARIAVNALTPELQLVSQGVMGKVDEANMAQVFRLLRGVSGVDFALYKPGTLRRRIARRMLLKKIDDLGKFVAYLHANPEELRLLHEDLLINVTRFFRDSAVFDFLKADILPRILGRRAGDDQVRIWVAGCSTGEEVYSIAITFLEHFGNKVFEEPSIQIFGTDVSEKSIAKARAGFYPESIASDLSPERLRRFFAKHDKGYQVSKRLRDLCIFATQNLCSDPPFSKLDLVSCRNVLIYLGREVQRQILATFHYSLRPSGFLLLGNSETINEFRDLFSTRDRKHGFYAKKPGPGRVGQVVSRRYLPASEPEERTAVDLNGDDDWKESDLQQLVDQIVLMRHGPPGVVVNSQLVILLTRGHTAPYFEMAQGTPSFYLVRMLRDSLSGPIHEALQRAIHENIPVQTGRLPFRDGDSVREVIVDILPIQRANSDARRYLLLFLTREAHTQLQASEPAVVVDQTQPGSDNPVANQLRRDLESTKLYLQSLIHDRDMKNQELIAAGEEIQSQNEELQSTNEELETTKEEIQSSNEELQTVNDELQLRNSMLNQVGNDLTNLLTSVNLPVLMLNNELEIRHFTPATLQIMSLRPSDIGRPIGEIRIHLNIDEFEPLVQKVLDTLVPLEMEVQDRSQRWHILRIRPYRTSDNKIDGVVVVLIDIDQSHRAQGVMQVARDFAQAVIENIAVPVVVLGADLMIRSANGAFRALAGSQAEDLAGRSLSDLLNALWGIAELRTQLESLREKPSGSRLQFRHESQSATRQILLVTSLVLQTVDDRVTLVIVEDITAREQVEELLISERNQLRYAVHQREEELLRTQETLRGLAAKLFTSQEEERRHLARELHDDVIQKLALIEINLAQLEGHIDDDEIIGPVEAVRAHTASLTADVRQLSHRLHPAILDDLGLTIALKALTEEFGEREKMPTTFQRENVPGKISHGVSASLFRIAQEAFRNVAKHAGKTHLRVTLKGTEHGISMEVADFGQGFDKENIQQGLGLISMIERARLVNGTVSIHSQLGKGTQVTVEVPIQQD